MTPIFKLQCLFSLFLYCYFSGTVFSQTNQDRPNIVWLVSEDNSKHWFRLYEESGFEMPNVERLAKQGIVFNNAFSNGPVCSVARSTIISGCYAPRVGTQYHRRAELAPMPNGLKMFPEYLRKAGYYTTNNAKEDYNLTKSDQVWDASNKKASYRNRQSGQPFFHVQNFGITHEGKLHFPAEAIQQEPNSLPNSTYTPFPYHPQNEVFRYTYGRYHDLHQQLDEQIGAFLNQLEEDGLMDNTIIFYYGDHGGVLPRSKGYIYESGVHVPMVVYVPKKWQHLMPVPAGTRVDGFVQFIDLGPTVLNLAGIDVPKEMDGQPFLGSSVKAKKLNKRQFAFSHADRFDEKYDLVRAIRVGKFKYIRNYQPFNVDALFNSYRYRMVGYRDWRNAYELGTLNARQEQFFKARSPEVLYNIEADPHELYDLSKNPEYQSTLKTLRKALQKQVGKMPDLSFFPEPYFIQKGIKNPVAFGQSKQEQIVQFIKVADLQLRDFSKVQQKLTKALADENPWVRYWALIVCSYFGEQATPFVSTIRKMAQSDVNNLVRTRAAEYLGLMGEIEAIALLESCFQKAEAITEANLILNSMTLLKDLDERFGFNLDPNKISEAWMKDKASHLSERVKYLNNGRR